MIAKILNNIAGKLNDRDNASINEIIEKKKYTIVNEDASSTKIETVRFIQKHYQEAKFSLLSATPVENISTEELIKYLSLK